jgi:hypothetical protein
MLYIMKDSQDRKKQGILTVGACEAGACEAGACEAGACDVAAGALVAAAVEEPPMVPEGLPSILMYIYNPASLSPHFSAGYPGQSFRHLLTSSWSAGM